LTPHSEPGPHAKRKDVARYLKLLPYSKVRERIIQSLAKRPIPTERVLIDSALGRVSNESIVTRKDIPSVPTSMMDGYAIKSSKTSKADTYHPICFRIRGSLRPGSMRPHTPIAGLDTYYVETGAPVPNGADTVVRVEDTKLVDGLVCVSKKLPKWKNVALSGEDLHRGAQVMSRGQIVNAADIALLIAIGRIDLSVFKKPKIGILSTGDELTSLSMKEEGKTVNNYSNLIAGYLIDAGALPVPLGVVKDNSHEVLNVVKQSIEDLDALITLGGSSVGKRDITPTALQQFPDYVEVFHGIKLVPVKPTGLSAVKGKPVVLLPAHYDATALSFFLVVKPLVNLLSGLAFDSRASVVMAKLVTRVSNPRSIGALFLIRLTAQNGNFKATPLRWGSNLISSLANANAFIQVGPRRSLKAGEDVPVTLLGTQEISRIPTRAAW
jgi:molybdenum cofactor synthesis domain-containing protein